MLILSSGLAALFNLYSTCAGADDTITMEHELPRSSPSRHLASAQAPPASASVTLSQKLRSFLAQRAEVAARVRGRRMTPATLLLRSFRDVDVGNKNECSFDDFCKCIDSTVPWPNVQELWELWNGFFDCFCSEHMIRSRSCSSMRYLLFICHHCGQDGLTIADISSISHETQMQLSTLSSLCVHKNEECPALTTALEVRSGTAVHSACPEALPVVPRIVAEGLRNIVSALLSSSITAAFDRCRSFAVVKSSRIIMSSVRFLQAIADQHLKGEGSVSVLLFALLLNEADVHDSGTVPYEQLCRFIRAFQVTLALKDQTCQALAQYFSSAEGSVDGFGKPVRDSTPIHYRKLLAHLRGAIPSLRQQKLEQLFHVLDRGNKGFLSVEDVSAALQYSMVSADAIRNLGHASAMLECSKTLIDTIAAVSSRTQAGNPNSVCLAAFVEFYHTLSISISRNPVFYAVLYKMWERGLENPGDLLDTGNMNFRPSKVFDAAKAATRRSDALVEDHALVSPFKQLLTDTDAPCNVRVASPSTLLANQGSFIASPEGFVSRLQSPKLMDESNFSSRKGNPAVTAFDGAAGVSSASSTNFRMYSHLNRSSNHLPVQYDPEIDGFGTIRRKFVGFSGDPLLAMVSAKNAVEANTEPDKLVSPACAGIFARVRGLLRQEHATNKYKSSHHSSLDSMKFVSRWNNFIWIAANVVIGDARSTMTSGPTMDKAESSRGIQGTVTVEKFSMAMNELSIYLTATELALLGQEYQSSKPGCLKYPRILKGLVSLTGQNRDDKKRVLWQGIENVSGFRGRVPLSNVFKAINVAGHPLVANHICDEGNFEVLAHRVATLTELLGTMADTLLRLFLISAAIVDADNVVLSPQTSTPQLLPVSFLH
jgi:hypothetical protein